MPLCTPKVLQGMSRPQAVSKLILLHNMTGLLQVGRPGGGEGR